jgi:hypothetical protein
MKNNLLSFVSLFLILQLNPFSTGLNAQDYQNGAINISPTDSIYLINLPQLKLPDCYKCPNATTLPPVCDNSETPYLRPPFQQYAYSCGQAGSIGYNFTYEINRVRDLPSDDFTNQYPPLFSWNFFNNAEWNAGVNFYHSFEAVKSNGQPNLIAYGGMGNNAYKWMTGYQEYYNGMFNKISDVYSIYVGDPEGLLTFKHWMFDHLNGSEFGGLANFYSDYGPGEVQLPEGTPEEGKYVTIQWGAYSGHSMTIVGWNDSIRWDYNNDGQYTNDIDINGDSIVDMKDWEIGGLKYINSFGYDWADSGFCYMMYKSIAEEKPPAGIWNKSVYVINVKEDYSPHLTFKVKLKYDQRNKLKISAGVSTDTTEYRPAHILDFEVFNYQGGQHYMQGNDTIEENKTIEIGLDVTPLISYINPGEPAKFFLLVHEHDPDYSGAGQIINFSLMDYLNGGIEIACPDSSISINDNGYTFLSVKHTINPDKVIIETEELPAFFSNQLFEYQMEASGGKEPYKWAILTEFYENQFQANYPSIEGEELVPNSSNSGSVVKELEFEFPFYGKKYDSIFLYVDGLLSFTKQRFPIPYQVNDMFLFKFAPLISPFLNHGLIYSNYYNDKIWFEGDENSAAFRWNISLEYNNIQYKVDFAVVLYPDGKIEYYYENFEIPETVKWITGLSAGDGVNFQVSDYSKLLSSKESKTIRFLPKNILTDFEITGDGLLSVLPDDNSTIYNLNIKVTDEDNISSSKEYQLSSGVLFSYVVNSGDDNWVDYGETAFLDFSIKNISNNSINDISLIIETSDPYISLIDSLENFGSIGPGEMITIEDAVSFYVETNIPDEYNIIFNVSINSTENNYEGNFSLCARAPFLSLGIPYIADGDNNRLDPGETTDVLVPIINSGHSKILNVNTTVSSNNEDITFNGPVNSAFDEIKKGSVVVDTFNVTINQECPEGEFAVFNYEITADPDIIITDSIQLIIGRVPVLIIDLDPEMLSGPVVALLLEELDVMYRYFKFLPDNLEDYQNLFVFLGKFYQPHILLQYEGEMLAGFLENTGNIYLEGGLTWGEGPPTAVHPMFNINTESITWNLIDTIAGIGGTFFEGLTFMYSGNMSYYNSFLVPIEPAFTILERLGEQHGFAVAFDEGNYKTVGSCIDFGGLDDGEYPSTKKFLLAKILEFFGIDVLITSIWDNSIPGRQDISCFPNPFSKQTAVNFYLREDDNVELVLFDFFGNKISTFYTGEKLKAGFHSVNIDGQGLANGIYFCVLKTNISISSIKIVKIN